MAADGTKIASQREAETHKAIKSRLFIRCSKAMAIKIAPSLSLFFLRHSELLYLIDITTFLNAGTVWLETSGGLFYQCI